VVDDTVEDLKIRFDNELQSPEHRSLNISLQWHIGSRTADDISTIKWTRGKCFSHIADRHCHRRTTKAGAGAHERKVRGADTGNQSLWEALPELTCPAIIRIRVMGTA
jgi:hypothetical protein